MFVMALTRPSLTMAWKSSRMYAGKRRTLGATTATIFKNKIRDVSVFVKCDKIFNFFGNYHKFELTSQGSAATY